MNQRKKTHEKAKIRRAPILDFINVQTHFRIDWRAGSDGQRWHDGLLHDDTGRMIPPNEYGTKPIGLDTIITAPDGQQRWTVLFPWYPSDRKSNPRGQFVRTKNHDNYKPKEHRVRIHYKNQWAIIAYFEYTGDIEPLKIACFPFTWFLDRGYSDYELEKANPKGFCFPGHKGRKNTVHWFNHCWSHKVIWGFNENTSNIKVTTSSVQTAISAMFQ